MTVSPVRLVDLLTVLALLIVGWAGTVTRTSGAPQMAVIFGMVSCLAWLIAAALPNYWDELKDDQPTIDGINALAAGTTGAAVLASATAGWQILF